MLTQSQKRAVADKANYLRSIGINISYKANNKAKQKPQNVAAVEKWFNKFGGYKEQGTGKLTERGIFIKAKGAKLRALKGVVSSEQITPGGIILIRPNGVPKKNFKYKIKGEGNQTYLEVSKGDNRFDRIVTLDPVALAKNPVIAARDAVAVVHPTAKKMSASKLLRLSTAIKEEKKIKGKKPAYIKLVVNGYEQKSENQFAAFFQYFQELTQELTDEDQEQYTRIYSNGKRRGTRKRALTVEEVSDIFHLKLIYKK